MPKRSELTGADVAYGYRREEVTNVVPSGTTKCLKSKVGASCYIPSA